MPELQIIGAPQSNYVWVARIACHEKGVPYTLVPVMPHTSEVEAIHPLGKIPALRHGDVTLAESRAIRFYIDHVFNGPSLVSRDAVEGALTEQWISIVNTHFDALVARPYIGAYFFDSCLFRLSFLIIKENQNGRFQIRHSSTNSSAIIIIVDVDKISAI